MSKPDEIDSDKKSDPQAMSKEDFALLTESMNAHKQGKIKESLAIYEQLLKRYPDEFNVIQLYAVTLGQLGRHVAAERYFKRAFELNNAMPTMLSNYSLLLIKMGRYEEALEVSDHFIQHAPHIQSGLHNRAIILRHLGRFKEAMTLLNQALEKYPNALVFKIEYAYILNKLHSRQKALDYYEQLIEDHEDHFDVQGNFAVFLQQYGYYKRALQAYERSLTLNPNQAATRFNYSLHLMLCGYYEKAWPEYEARWASVAISEDPAIVEIRNQIPSPLWDGKAPLKDKILLIYSEQGLGDAIQFLRYFPLLKQKGAIIHFIPRKPHEAIASLLTNSKLVDKIIHVDKPFKAPDFHCGLLSLVQPLKSEFGLFPPPVAFEASTQTKQAWQERLGKRTRPLRIGFVMNGSGHIANRDMALKDWRPLFALPHIEWICLQKELREDAAAYHKETNAFRFFGEDLTDFSQTAALIDLCDHVISIDTSIAHLAGMQAQKRDNEGEGDGNTPSFLHLLLPHYPSFRWGLKSKTTPWYPSATLWRQTVQGDWSKIIKAMINLLSYKQN